MRIRQAPARVARDDRGESLRAQLRRSFQVALGSAVLASAAATVAALLLRLFTGLLTPAEIFGDRLTILIPLPLFSRMLQLFGPNAKHVFFVTLVVGEFALTALAATLYVAVRSWLASLRAQTGGGADSSAGGVVVPLWEIPLLAVVLWVVSAGCLAPALGSGFFGATLPGGPGGLIASELGPNLVLAASFALLLRRELVSTTGMSSQAPANTTSRRRLLRQTGVALAVLGGGVLLWEAISAGLGAVIGVSGRHAPRLSLSSSPNKITPPPTPNYGELTPVSGLTAEVTPAADFYYVSKNLVSDPSISVGQWRLSIEGRVLQPYSLSYDDLRALPAVQQYHTLECISNDVGGNLMSNALFTGVRLADVLNKAGVQPDAAQVIFRAQDGYSDSLHLSQALNPDSLIAYLINGAPLPQPHGYPARLLIPGLYGMKNGKWLTSLTVDTGTFDGYWEQRGWTREAFVKMTTRIDIPHDGDLLTAKPTIIGGVAYAGDKGISRVDVSVDGGQSWRTATLRRPLGALTWVLWELAWTPTPGSHIIAARCVDGEGNVQTAQSAPPLPDGASGYDAISIVAH